MRNGQAVSAARQLKPGAMVESNDRLLLGWIVDVDHTDGAEALRMRTRDRPTTLLVPLELVETIDPDGTARLSCRRHELERLAAGGRGQGSGAGVTTLGPSPASASRAPDPRPLTPDIDYVPIGVVVQNRQPPRQEGDRFIVPIYEEQLVVDKRLVLRAEVRIRVGQSVGEAEPAALAPDLPTLPAKRQMERAQAVPARRTPSSVRQAEGEPESRVQRWVWRFLG